MALWIVPIFNISHKFHIVLNKYIDCVDVRVLHFHKIAIMLVTDMKIFNQRTFDEKQVSDLTKMSCAEMFFQIKINDTMQWKLPIAAIICTWTSIYIIMSSIMELKS